MNLSDFNQLSEDEQYRWSWDADEGQRAEIASEFLRLYGNPKIHKVIVDGYGLGDAPCVYVELKQGEGRIHLPKSFMRRIVIRRYLATGKLKFG